MCDHAFREVALSVSMAAADAQWIFGFASRVETLSGNEALRCGSASLLTTVGQGWDSRPRVTMWFPALKHDKPLDGGGGKSCWAVLFIEGPGFGFDPLPPPIDRAGRVSRLCRRGGCRTRGLKKDEGWGVCRSLFWWLSGVGLAICSPAPGESFSLLSCMRRWVLSNRLSSSGSGKDFDSTWGSLAGGRIELVQGAGGQDVGGHSSSVQASLWPPVGTVLARFPWMRGSLGMWLMGWSIWGCRRQNRTLLFRMEICEQGLQSHSKYMGLIYAWLSNGPGHRTAFKSL